MKDLELQIIEVTKQYGITLKKSLVTFGTIILYCTSLEDVNKLAQVYAGLDAKITTDETGLTVGIIF